VLAYTPNQITAVIDAFNQYQKTAPEKSALALSVGCPPGTIAPTFLASPFWNGTEAEGREVFRNLFDIGPVMEMMGSRSYVEQVRSHTIPLLNRRMNSGTLIIRQDSVVTPKLRL
jgi:hypothetical protein